MKKILLVVLLIVVYAINANAGKKIIGHGWEFVSFNSRDLNINKTALEKTPFDALTIGYDVPTDKPGESAVFTTESMTPFYKKAWFADYINEGKKFKSDKIKEIFINVWMCPNVRYNWDDDKGWDKIANNLGVLAYTAKNAGFKGIFIDHEDYSARSGGGGQFLWQPSDGDYDKTAKLARKEGAKVMKAICKEYPDITLLTMWLLTYRWQSVYSNDPLQSSIIKNDLWFWFVNGMLDTITPNATIVDATENGYNMEHGDFVTEKIAIRESARKLVVKENQAKYDKQIKVGFGVYLTNFRADKKSSWYYEPLNGSKADKAREVFADALNSTDEYIWLWEEDGKWDDWVVSAALHDATIQSFKKNPTWETQIPGIKDAIMLAKDMQKNGRNIIEQRRKAGNLVNLLPDGSFVKFNQNPDVKDYDKEGNKESWNFWQQAFSKGSVSPENSKGYDDTYSIKMTGATGGSVLSGTKIIPEKLYAIEAYVYGDVSQKIDAIIHWKRNGNWGLWSKEVSFVLNQEAANGWKYGFIVVKAPLYTEELWISIGANNQKPAESAWFDCIGIYEL